MIVCIEGFTKRKNFGLLVHHVLILSHALRVRFSHEFELVLLVDSLLLDDLMLLVGALNLDVDSYESLSFSCEQWELLLQLDQIQVETGLVFYVNLALDGSPQVWFHQWNEDFDRINRFRRVDISEEASLDEADFTLPCDFLDIPFDEEGRLDLADLNFAQPLIHVGDSHLSFLLIQIIERHCDFPQAMVVHERPHVLCQ